MAEMQKGYILKASQNLIVLMLQAQLFNEDTSWLHLRHYLHHITWPITKSSQSVTWYVMGEAPGLFPHQTCIFMTRNSQAPYKQGNLQARKPYSFPQISTSHWIMCYIHHLFIRMLSFHRVESPRRKQHHTHTHGLLKPTRQLQKSTSYHKHKQLT